MTPVVSIVGKAKSGKTTLLVKLVSLLSERGYQIATAKHVFHELAFDKPDKDSWRHIEAGSQATIVGSSDKLILIKPVNEGAKLDDMLRIFGEDYDLILVEGFKQSDTPKIEVHRREVGPPLQSLPNLIAIATNEDLPAGIKQFALSDVVKIADFIESTFIKSAHNSMSVYVNNKMIRLSSFRARFISNIIIGLIDSLKIRKKIRQLDIRLKYNKISNHKH